MIKANRVDKYALIHVVNDAEIMKEEAIVYWLASQIQITIYRLFQDVLNHDAKVRAGNIIKKANIDAG